MVASGCFASVFRRQLCHQVRRLRLSQSVYSFSMGKAHAIPSVAVCEDRFVLRFQGATRACCTFGRPNPLASFSSCRSCLTHCISFTFSLTWHARACQVLSLIFRVTRCFRLTG